jgi:hypothetical protein
MIRDLSETLRALLAPALPLADISFERPTDQFQPAQTTVNLFLYDVRENVELRNNEPIVRRLGNQARTEPPPLRIACSYLVTAWPTGGGDLALEEHGLLSDSLRRLASFPTIPPEFLQGGLVGQQPPLPTVTAQPTGLNNPAEFWTALGNRLRVSLTLTATISLPVFEEIEGPIVLTKRTGFTPGSGPVEEELASIGGSILAPATAIRASATLIQAAAQQGTLQVAADAANFRPGDVVILEDPGAPGHNDRLAITGVAGATVTLARLLTPPAYPAGTTMRIADLEPQQIHIRLNRVTGMEPGAEIAISQDATAESATVRDVNTATRSITLLRGLQNSYSMTAAAPPVAVQYGVAGALVEVSNAAIQTVSRPDGRFLFGHIPRGPQSLRVSKQGFQTVAAAAIEVPAPSNRDYNVVLTPI